MRTVLQMITLYGCLTLIGVVALGQDRRGGDQLRDDLEEPTQSCRCANEYLRAHSGCPLQSQRRFAMDGHRGPRLEGRAGSQTSVAADLIW